MSTEDTFRSDVAAWLELPFPPVPENEDWVDFHGELVWLDTFSAGVILRVAEGELIHYWPDGRTARAERLESELRAAIARTPTLDPQLTSLLEFCNRFKVALLAAQQVNRERVTRQ